MSSRRLLPFAFLVTIGSTLAAQARALHVGFQASIALSTIKGDNQEDSGNLAGPLVGGFASLALSPRFSIESGLNYAGKGARYDDDAVDLKIGYVQVPLLGRFQGGDPSRGIVPIALAGPVFSFKAGCSIKTTQTSFACDDTSTDVAGTDLGFLFGVGAARGPFRAMLRYEHGLKNINADGPAKVKNRSISIALGYELQLGAGRR